MFGNQDLCKRNKKGFTLIEVIIALLVLTVAIFGVYGAFSSMVVATNQTTDRFVAAYLAQEGIELVRNLRDQNWILDREWNYELEGCESDSQGCQTDYENKILDAYGSYLNIDSRGFYVYDPGAAVTPTKIKRKINIDPIIRNGESLPYAIKVTATVFWDQKKSFANPEGKQGSITAEDYLYNWY
jgi:prepilin-type N-terminal cleavage/methylation domain-containing protein